MSESLISIRSGSQPAVSVAEARGARFVAFVGHRPFERSGPRVRKCIFGLIISSTAIRMMFALATGLGIDESYTVATSRYFDFSYFDHPPLAWWLSWAAIHISGTDSPMAVRLPFLALFALSTWLMYRLTAVLFGEEAGLWSAVTLNLAPVFSITTGSWVLPDGPLIAAMLASVLCIARAMFQSNVNSKTLWIASGLFGGLALLSKYHGIFLFTGTALFLICTPKFRHWLRRPWPYLAVMIALLCTAPVIAWNAEHGWISIIYQGARATPAKPHLLGPLRALGGQFLVISPWIWIPLVATWIAALRTSRVDPKIWFLSYLAAGPIGLFTIVAAWTSGPVLDHWAAPGYLMLFPLLGAAISRHSVRRGRQIGIWLKSSAAVLCALLLSVAIELRFGWFDSFFPGTRDLQTSLLAATDWSDLRFALIERGLLTQPHVFVTGTKWNVTGKVDYALEGLVPVLCRCADQKEYAIISPQQPFAGWNGIIVAHDLSIQKANELYGSSFEYIDALAPVTITRSGHFMGRLSIFEGRNFRPN
jgi:4-amino-4-deoxy-L-arabinose transferase-like glycosyltransferase